MDISAAKNDEQREATYRFLNDEISAQHRLLFEEARGLDTKATVVAGFAAAAVSFLLANQRGTIWWFALCGYFSALGLALAGLWPRRWYGLVPAALRDELSGAAPVFVVGEVAGTKVALYDRNYRKARNKVVLWAASVVFLAIGSSLSVWASMVEELR